MLERVDAFADFKKKETDYGESLSEYFEVTVKAKSKDKPVIQIDHGEFNLKVIRENTTLYFTKEYKNDLKKLIKTIEYGLPTV